MAAAKTAMGNSTVPGPKDLSGMSADQLREFLNSFDVVLSDCDGVLWNLNVLIPGAVQALNRLQDIGKRVYLVSNNSLVPYSRYEQKTKSGGMDLKKDQLINPSKVIAWYLKKVHFHGKAFVIASKAFRQVLAEHGIDMLPESFPPTNEDNVEDSIRNLFNVGSTKAVIVDFSITDGWTKLVHAINCLAKEDVLYLSGASDEWLPLSNDKKILGCKHLNDLISHYSGRTPIVCAKPSSVLGDCVRETCQINDPKRCLFIGDMISTDMIFAAECGFQKLLVETGVDKIEDALGDVKTRPDYYASSLRSLLDGIDQLSNETAGRENSR
ncbi:chronophin [Megalopta genalis]|uniref:chronophin n=1 Tax=Megalopta genalis TaxID=115081 RepID=UPI003FD06BF1